MSNSSWPPELKAWVQNCLSKATPANKSAVNAELKEVLFRAHKDGTINTTDWSNVELQALKAQTARTTHVPAPPQPFFPVVIPPPPTVTAYPVYHPPAPSSIASSSTDQTPTKKEKRKAAKANKKRKTEMTDNFPSAYQFTGPENGADDPDALARRAARFNKPPASAATGPVAKPVGVAGWFGGDDEDGGSMPGFGQVGKKRIRVGGGDVGGRYAEPIAEEDPNVIDWDRYTIKGTSNKLEKRYLRLTSEPDPADIRPLRVLEQSLQLVVKNWKENRNYAYAVDQFKSMRQDLTVQRIKNEFTVKVYEYHARVALEAKDLGEYNQCQTMLRQLYELGIHGHFEEFLSYRILYLLHTRNRGDMASLLPKLTPANKADSGVQHALQVAAAVATSNYYKIFQLYDTAPNMSGFIMDHFVERERISALAILAKSHMTLTLPYLTKTLAFEADSIADKFLVDHEIALYTNPTPAPAPNASTNHWRPIKASAPTPLKERIWDCKKALVGVRKAMERYRVVDLKGQVD